MQQPEPEINPFTRIATDVAEILIQKQKAYGDSYGKSPEFLELLYPNGIQPKQYKDLLFVIRIFDKLMRIASDKEAFNEDPYLDINGYSLLHLVQKTLRAEEEKSPAKEIS
jgi:hypothetical protein